MGRHAAVRHRAGHRWLSCGSVRVRALLSLGLVALLGMGGTFAYWSDTATISGTTIKAGNLDLKVNGQDSVTGYASLNITNMVPGNTTAGVVTIKNAGSVPFTYSMSASASNGDTKALGAALAAKITGDSAVTGTSPNATCNGAALANTATTFGNNLISSASPRSLAVGSSETICIQAMLPANANTSLQGATTDITFTVTANQLQ